MNKKDNNYNKIIYQLTIEDIQTVAEENFGRELSTKEINKIIDPIGDGIQWYEIINEVIKSELEIEELDEFDKEN